MEIKDENQLKELISQELEKALRNIAQNISSQLTENILQDIYGNPVSEYYDRTMQFLKSVIKPTVTIKGDSVSVTIGMDSSLIESSLGGKNKLNKHMSVDGSDVWNGIPISEAILTWWDEGTKNSPIKNLSATNYWTKVMGDSGRKNNPNYNKLESVINQEIIKALSKFGDIKPLVKLNMSMS